MALRSVFGNRDIRERKNLANRDYYLSLIGSRKEAVFLTDAAGDLHLLNKPAQVLSGYAEEDIRDLHVRDVFITRKDEDNPLDVRQFQEFRSPIFLVDARRYLIPVILDFKEIEGQKFLCTCTEAPPQQETPAGTKRTVGAPEERFPASAEPPKTDQPAVWSSDFEHRVRNLLGSILGFSTVLSKDTVITGNRKLSGAIDSIIRSGTQLRQLFNQAGGGREEYEVNRTICHLQPVIQKAVILSDHLSRQHNIPVKVDPGTDVKIFSDEGLLLELLKYLTGKALVYTRNDHVRITVSEDRPNRKAMIAIDNLGQDIPQGVINYIRRENQKEEYDLTNPLVARNPEILEMLHTLNRMDGKIGFTTGSNMGETAHITLPLASDSEEMDDLVSLENAVKNKGLRVLIIEDEKFSAAILEMFLENIADTIIAYSGNEALNIIELQYNRGTVFNAVITDIGLPPPWDGMLLKQEIGQRWPEYQNIPFLVQTGYAGKSMAARIRDGGFTAHLVKPVGRNDLLVFLDKYCR